MGETYYYLKDHPVPKTPDPGQTPAPWGETEVVGARRFRVDAYERVSGTAVYPSDLRLPNLLYGAILRSPHPHAKVRKMDTSQAKQIPGVRAILTPQSPAVKDLKWRYNDEYVIGLLEPHCRFEGEAVAAVAAETPYAAWDAVRAIQVEYEVLPFVSDERQALKEDAPKVHPKGNTVKTDKYSRGDLQKGFAAADLTLSRSYRSECQLHTPMELHGCVANWEGDCLTLWESTQGVYAVQSQVAESLNMPFSRVRVIGHYMGGGFGSKLKAGKYTVLAAVLAKQCGRPVKMFLSREESYLCVGNRPPANMTVKAGVKTDGTLTALEFDCTGTSGAYPSGGTSLVDWLARDLYLCPNVRTKATDIFTNAGPVRPFRAPGHPQGSWAMEQLMDELAEAIGMDPVAFRLKNIPQYSQAREGNPEYTSNGLAQCLKQGAQVFGWEAARKRSPIIDGDIRRGVGMAACSWFIGGGWPPATVILKLFSDGSANLNMGASDIGTGTKTIMAMVAAEELGIKPELVQIEHADTGTTQYASPSGGSKTVPTEAPTVRAAAIEVKRQLLEMAGKQLAAQAQELTVVSGAIQHRSQPDKKVRIRELTELKQQGVLMGVGYRGPNPDNPIIPFGAQFCEVAVNIRTGELRLLRFVAAHDSGRVMNRLTYDNQVIGGITMGIGFGMNEFRLLDGSQTGKLVNRNWHDYKLPTALDVPVEVRSSPVELPDDAANTTGAKGLGEPVTIPTAPAIANAVYNAVGVRLTRTPINPLQLINALARPKEV